MDNNKIIKIAATATIIFQSAMTFSYAALLNENLQDAIDSAKQEYQEALQEITNARQEQLRQQGQNLGNTAIQYRLKSLEQLESQLQNQTKISEQYRNEIQTGIENSKSGLENLQLQIQNESDLDELRNQVRKIYTEYRVYAVELPKDYGLMACGLLDGVYEEEVLGAMTKVETLIENLTALGEDTSDAELLLTEIENNLDAAMGFVTLAAGELRQAIPAEDLTEPRSHIDAGKGYLEQAREQFQNAKGKLELLIEEVKSLSEI